MPGIWKQRRVKTKGACRKCFKWHKDARLEQAYWNVTSTNTTINHQPLSRTQPLDYKVKPTAHPFRLVLGARRRPPVRANYSSTTSWQLFWRPLWGPSTPRDPIMFAHLLSAVGHTFSVYFAIGSPKGCASVANRFDCIVCHCYDERYYCFPRGFCCSDDVLYWMHTWNFHINFCDINGIYDQGKNTVQRQKSYFI